LDPRAVSLAKHGTLTGAAVAAASAWSMLAANARTINPASSAWLLLLWVVAGALLGTGAAWVGGRAARALKRPFALGASPFAALVTGWLLLPEGLGALVGLATFVLVLFRHLALRRFPRLDPAFALGVALLVPGFLDGRGPALPPPLPPDASLAAGTPAPGALPVTVTVHTEPGYPELPATHVELRALDSAAPGRRAALWTGRFPARTRVGTGEPVRLPGGGGISRTWNALGVRALLAPFPAGDPDAPPFAATGTLAALAEASGVPVLRTPPAPGEPEHFLRLLESAGPVDLETARELRGSSAWIDVWLDPAGGGRLAFSGPGFATGRVEGRANLVDVAPTALHLLGLAVPRACDGRVLSEVMESPGPGSRAIRYRALGRPPSASDSTTER
jgi:hypothetical protein